MAITEGTERMSWDLGLPCEISIPQGGALALAGYRMSIRKWLTGAGAGPEGL